MPQSFAEGRVVPFVDSTNALHLFPEAVSGFDGQTLPACPCPLPSANGNVLAARAIQTDFCGGMVHDTPEVNFMVASMTPLGRVRMTDDIGASITLLLLDDSRRVNGQWIEVSGGMLFL